MSWGSLSSNFHYDFNGGSVFALILVAVGVRNLFFAFSRMLGDLVGVVGVFRVWVARRYKENYLRFIVVHGTYALISASTWQYILRSQGVEVIPGTRWPLYVLFIVIMGNAVLKYLGHFYTWAGKVYLTFIVEYPLAWFFLSLVNLLIYRVLYVHFGHRWIFYLGLIHLASLVYFIYLLWRSKRQGPC